MHSNSMQFSPFSYDVIAVRTEYCTQHHALKCLRSISALKTRHQISQRHRPLGNIFFYILTIFDRWQAGTLLILDRSKYPLNVMSSGSSVDIILMCDILGVRRSSFEILDLLAHCTVNGQSDTDISEEHISFISRVNMYRENNLLWHFDPFGTGIFF